MCGTNGEVGRVGTAVRRGRHGVMEYLGQVEKTRKEGRLGAPQVKNGAPLYTLQNGTQISTSSVPFCAQGPSWWTALLAKLTLASIVVCFVFGFERVLLWSSNWPQTNRNLSTSAFWDIYIYQNWRVGLMVKTALLFF